MKTILGAVAAIGLSVLALAAPSKTLAAERGQVEVGAFGGYNLLSDNSELGDAAVADYVPASAPAAGLRLGYSLTTWLGIEGEFKYAFAKFRTGELPAAVLGARAHAIATLPSAGRVQLFATLGVGTEKLFADARPALNESDADASAVVGLGTRVALAERIGARIDGRLLAVPGREGVALNQEFYFGIYALLGGGAQVADVPPDSDGDGIVDARDKCPQQPETKNGHRDDDGCPEVLDGDGDGVADDADKCPTTGETNNGFEDTDGCPDDPDTDKDGIADSLDRCPMEPETKNGYKDEDGCPDKVPEQLKKVAGTISGIEFDENKAVITKGSYKVLDQVVETLRTQGATSVIIEGHTDDTGTPERNIELSLARANAVKAYLVGKGIAPERIATAGVGANKPIADNKTPEGRAKNRRIEFKLK